MRVIAGDAVMKKDLIKKALCGLVLGVVSVGAQADLYEDGLMAYAVGNYSDAGKLLMGAADAGNEGAEHMLMRLFSEGKLVAKDLDKETLKWTLKAAEKGVMQAQFAVAEIYAFKEGDFTLAMSWYREAAKQGHPQAFFELGAILENGAEDISVDTDESERMYSIAATEFDIFAQKGDSNSQFKLANMYQLAQGVEKDMDKSIIWMEKSAMQGHVMAQLSLGRLYAQGDDVEQDIRLAAFWLELAAAQGLNDASIMLSEIQNDNGDNLALLM